MMRCTLGHSAMISSSKIFLEGLISSSPYSPGFWKVGRAVVQQVEHVVAFVLMRADDLGVDRHMVGDQRIGANAFSDRSILANSGH